MPRSRCRPEYVPLRTATHRRASPCRSTEVEANTESSPHDDIAYVKRQQTDRANGPSASGWSHSDRSASRRRGRGRRLGALLLLIPLMVGLLGVPASPTRPASSAATSWPTRRRGRPQLKKDIEKQKEQVAQLDALQTTSPTASSQTADQLKGINADLVTVKAKITTWRPRSTVIKADYNALVEQLKTLDAQLVDIEAQEAAKRAELAERKALLADRLRSAYDTDRTSLLETFLSGGTFTDLLAEMSYYIDVGEQDKALANQVAKDQETLAELHQTTIDARSRTDDLRAADGRLQARPRQEPGRARTPPRPRSRSSRSGSPTALAQQKRDYAQLAREQGAPRSAPSPRRAPRRRS